MAGHTGESDFRAGTAAREVLWARRAMARPPVSSASPDSPLDWQPALRHKLAIWTVQLLDGFG